MDLINYYKQSKMLGPEIFLTGCNHLTEDERDMQKTLLHWQELFNGHSVVLELITLIMKNSECRMFQVSCAFDVYGENKEKRVVQYTTDVSHDFCVGHHWLDIELFKGLSALMSFNADVQLSLRIRAVNYQEKQCYENGLLKAHLYPQELYTFILDRGSLMGLDRNKTIEIYKGEHESCVEYCATNALVAEYLTQSILSKF